MQASIIKLTRSESFKLGYTENIYIHLLHLFKNIVNLSCSKYFVGTAKGMSRTKLQSMSTTCNFCFLDKFKRTVHAVVFLYLLHLYAFDHGGFEILFEGQMTALLFQSAGFPQGQPYLEGVSRPY